MKKFLLVVLGILTISTLIGGKYHWNQKVSAVQGGNFTVARDNDDRVEKRTSVDSQKVIENHEKDKLVKLDKANFSPKDLQPIFLKAIREGRSVHLMIIGSSSTSERNGAWPRLLEKKLLDTYGYSIIHVTIKEVSGRTSKQVVEENMLKDFVNMKPDILLLEPFLLYDNGKIKMSKRLENISNLIKPFKKANPDLAVLIQPANPIYGATYYPQEENDLERYAQQNNYRYLDHWKAWPDYNKKELNDFLTEENIPNRKGNEIWADYLKEYFVRDIGKE